MGTGSLAARSVRRHAYCVSVYSSRKRGLPDSLPSAPGRLTAKPCPTVKTQKMVNITLLSHVLLLQEYQEGLFTRPWPLHQ